MQKYFSGWVFLIKILIIAGAYYVISDKLMNSENFDSFLWQERFTNLSFNQLSLLFLALLLTVVNWYLEILKWKNLTSSATDISFSQAAKQSFSSLTASLLTPNRIGEYGAKAIYYRRAFRPKILLLNFIGNAYQMLVTILFGLYGIWVLKAMFNVKKIYVNWILGTLSILFCLVLILFYKQRWMEGLKRIIDKFSQIPKSVHQTTFYFSAARYLVFSHQFYLFLLFFGIELPYETAMAIIVSMYLISSIIPGFVLFDWLVKGSVAVTLFRIFSLDEMLVLSITGSMWLLNFAVPAIIGSYYVLTFKSHTLVYSEPNISE